MKFDSIVKGGHVVSPTGTVEADIGISGGKIAAIEPNLGNSAVRVIDARRHLVIPGAVDVHTHFANTLGTHGATADDYESGSRAAAAGGITTCINYAFQVRSETLETTLTKELEKASGKSIIDYGVHIGVTDLDSTPALTEFASLVDKGVTSLKVFTTVDEFRLSDRDLLRLFEVAHHNQMLVNVHAEDDGLIEHLTDRYLAESPSDIKSLIRARPVEAEAVAVHRSATYARVIGCPVYFVHVSSAAALEAIRHARQSGGIVYAEARPAYLYLDESAYSLPDQQGRKFASIPPLRSVHDQDALWKAMADGGDIQTYATDHTTWLRAIKTDPSLNFSQVPGGVPDVQTSIGMLFSEGVTPGRLSVERFVELCSSNPAKIFGLWPRKGRIGVGSDADLVLIDPQIQLQLRQEDMLSRCDYLPYEGYQAHGWPVMTIAGGEVIFENGLVSGTPGRGRFLHRERLAHSQPVVSAGDSVKVRV